MKTVTGLEEAKKIKRSVEETISLNRVMQYRYPPLIKRLQNKEGLTKEETESLFEDLLKFLYLCGISDLILAPSEKIDLAWHHFILFTKEYRRFCIKYIGCFVHHSPQESGNRPKGVPIVQQTLDLAEKTFGPLSGNWRFPERAFVECSPSYDCNGDAQCSTKG